MLGCRSDYCAGVKEEKNDVGICRRISGISQNTGAVKNKKIKSGEKAESIIKRGETRELELKVERETVIAREGQVLVAVETTDTMTSSFPEFY